MNRIKELRTEMKLSMRETAAQIGIPYTTYVNYEKGEREPNSEMLIMLADFFDVTIDYMLCRVDASGARIDRCADDLTAEERRLVQDYRRLPEDGKEKIREQMAMHIAFYAEKNPALPGLESAV